MKLTTNLVLKIMNIIFWFIFIGLCIKTGATLYSALLSYSYNPIAAKNLYRSLDLFELKQFGKMHYTFVLLVQIIGLILKAYLAFLVLDFLKKLDLTAPFTKNLSVWISKMSYVSLLIGLIYGIGVGYCDSYLKEFNVLQQLDWHGDEYLFIGAIVFVISLVFKKGEEFQIENELTI